MKKIFYFLLTCVMMASCSADFPSEADGGVYGSRSSSDPIEDEGGSQWESITAGEWNDILHWDFWSGLMLKEEFLGYNDDWGFFTDNLIYVRVEDEDGNGVINLPIAVCKSDGSELWKTMTDNKGYAALWVNLYGEKEAIDNLKFKINNTLKEDSVQITHWGENVKLNTLVSNKKETRGAIQVAFFVDATGSMCDEMDFLKTDLEEIITRAEAFDANVFIETAALVYRDIDDDYVTRNSDFTKTFADTKAFIAQQESAGGGDWPEAVHTALEVGLENMNWDLNARSRIVFLILDAPCHSEQPVLQSVRQSITKYAEKGIHIIPVSASGIDKSTEFLLRYFALATDGTYVFITNDSGIGDEHIEPTVGEYEVELLRDLIYRLIVERI